MKPPSGREVEWARHTAEWRDTAQVASQWREAGLVEPRALIGRASGDWWSVVESLGLTLFVTREYEHLAMALAVENGAPRISFFPVPHPSGLVVDRRRQRLYIASTRNPNQIYTLRPASKTLERSDMKTRYRGRSPFVPVCAEYYPGSLYLHDLALIGNVLHGNAAGQNAVVRLRAGAGFERVWWPKSIERGGAVSFACNYLQLNSIAAGKSLRESYFSASAAEMGRRRPGHLNFPVDGRGVIFSGRTREPVCTGLTRPHSARLAQGKIWVANSGYGELGYFEAGRLEVVRRLPGWTRGLCIVGDIAFVGTSRVIPRFAGYAPGLDASHSRCALHAVECRTGELLGSLEWPEGNQIFAIDWIASRVSPGFPFQAPFRRAKQEEAFFYTYLTE